MRGGLGLGWLAAALLAAALLAGCASEPRPVVPAQPDAAGRDPGDGDGDGDGDETARDDDAAGDGDDDGDAGAGTRDASAPWPEPPDAIGVHLSIQRGPYETTPEVFLLDAERPGIHAELAGGATLRVTLDEAPGTLRCADRGVSVQYAIASGRLLADRDRGACTIDVEAFGATSGASITATFRARVVRVQGEGADELELAGRIHVGHP